MLMYVFFIIDVIDDVEVKSNGYPSKCIMDNTMQRIRMQRVKYLIALENQILNQTVKLKFFFPNYILIEQFWILL